MTVLHLECGGTECEELIAELHARGTLGVVEQPSASDRCLLQAFFASSAPTAGLEPWLVTQEEVPERDWIAETQASYPPLLIGERFFLAPEWTRQPTPPGRLRLPSHPGMACGTGYHEATQLCLEAMEQSVHTGITFVDIGIGSGLLCVAAHLLGAHRHIGCDVDSDAVVLAREYTTMDGVNALLYVGSATALRDSLADVLVANISASVHLTLAREYARLLKPDGVALISGYEEYEEQLVFAALSTAGLRLLNRRERHHWVCQVVSRLA